LFFLTPLRNNIIRDLRNNLKRKLIHVPISFFQKFKRGDVISRITLDITEIEWSIIGLLELALKDPTHIIIFLIGLSLINIKLTILCFLLFPITGIIIAVIAKNLKKTSFLNQEKIAELISLIDQNISGIKIIKAFNKENFVLKIFNKENEKQKNIANKVLWKKDLSSPMSEALSTITMVVIIWVGGSMVLNESLQAESFIGFTIMFSQIIPPTKSLTSSIYSIKKGAAALNRINELLNYKEEKISSKLETINTFKDGISFSNVNFSYENQNVLKDISFSIKKGEKIGIVGESGCGKTTIIDLLLNFYSIDSGSIKIDSENINSQNLRKLRSLFGLVSQDVFLFNDSIINNIRFGNTNNDLEKIIDSSKKANAHQFISKLENGYNTLIKNQGKNLSAGEKQRISIARALFGNYPILIFDEATSSLDSKSSKHIQDIINNIGKDKTCIIITHKLQSIKSLDRILVMKDGKIIQSGNHKLLINSSKVYQQLYNLDKTDE
ncbi:MAG: antibiotic ABC transporter ATP-binding protein, partial [Flavobacteriales bacterium]|nr:antibiotic ABC transporter ATP-binding protein [Flavobacteriales bacterium]